MNEWVVSIACSEIPDSENAWALSYVLAHKKQIAIVVDPDAPDIELTALHELLHGLLTYLRQADSELVEETTVVILSEQIKREMRK